MVASTAAIAALVSTGFISLAPNLILLAFPRYAEGEGMAHISTLSFGQALAAGGLLGDVFLHILPHAPNMEEDQVGLWLLLGFVLFLAMDLFIRSHHHSHDHTSHDHSSDANKKEEHQDSQSLSPWSSVILLNLVSDALHNFTDGLAIGASFSVFKETDGSFVSLLKSRGALATLSILFHEIPHELGDFCILVKAGFSWKKAILAQFGTAVAAMLGTVVGLSAAHFGNEDILMYITAGGFVYLACVNIMPAVLEERGSVGFRLGQITAFCVGVGFMCAVAFLEEHDHHGHHSHGHHHHHDHAEVLHHDHSLHTEHSHEHHSHGHEHNEL